MALEIEIVTTDPMCPGCAELRERIRELHRRCQIAEGAVLRKMKHEQAGGAPLAKRLAIAGYLANEQRIAEAVRWITDDSLGTPEERSTKAVEILNGEGC